MRILVTGADGFIGRYVVQELEHHGITVSSWNGPSRDGIDLLDKKDVIEKMNACRPDVILHLAGASSVAQSWKDPATTIATNVIGSVNLWQAAMAVPVSRFVHLSSAEIYSSDLLETQPIDELRPIDPRSPYATSKQTAELLLTQLARETPVNLVIVRPFNIVGPGQRPGFVLTDFAHQIIRTKLQRLHTLYTGNLDVTRDFLDVRDAAVAYRLLCTETYERRLFNLCSGSGHKLMSVLHQMMGLAQLSDVEVKRDPLKDRPNDRPMLIGNREAISDAVHWAPQIPWEITLRDVLRHEESTYQVMP
jgi:GDP-4-dehydro-6-deoxy-D-mannose reductase